MKNKIEIIGTLYVRDGKSVDYISDLLGVDKYEVKGIIDNNNFIRGNNKYIKKSSKKFLNVNRDKIINLILNYGNDLDSVASELNKPSHFIKELVSKDNRLQTVYRSVINNNEEQITTPPILYTLKEILGYPNYYMDANRNVYKQDGEDYIQLSVSLNTKSNKHYVNIEGKSLCVENIYYYLFIKSRREISSVGCRECVVNGKKYTFKTDAALNRFLNK